MIPTDLSKTFDAQTFLKRATTAFTTGAVESLLKELPVVGDHEYVFNPENPADSWREGFLHWYPVGRERGNAGRIKLAGSPENPIAERAVNAFEAIVEMMRQLELKKGNIDPPLSPREAVQRYFDLPPLSEVPKMRDAIQGLAPRKYVRELARRIRIRLIREGKQYSVAIEDDGIGQPPAKIHSTLLSLGQSDKSDKPYLIGVFGQGGSSAYATCSYSWLISRRHPELLNGLEDGVGWTLIKRLYPKPPRRDDYFAYLAAHPDGRVPWIPASVASALSIKNGTTFMHINYDFGSTEPARTLYSALNHLLFDPILPYELYTGPERKPDPMFGNGYRLSLNSQKHIEVDKTFRDQVV